MIWILRTSPATRRRSLALRAALAVHIVLALSCIFAGQTESGSATAKPAEGKPLTSDERAELLKLIRSLQERLDKLEAAQAAQTPAAQTPAASSGPQTETKFDPSTSDDPHVWMEPVVKDKPVSGAPSAAS